MSDQPELPRIDVAPELLEAMRLWGSNQEASRSQVQDMSDAGDPVASLVVAWMYQQTNWPDGIPYARRVVEAGFSGGHTVANYTINTLGDPARSGDAEALLRGAAYGPSAFPAHDLVASAVNLVAQGNDRMAADALRAALAPLPEGLRRSWENLVKDVQPLIERLQGREADVQAAAEAARSGIESAASEIASERDDAKELVEQARGYSHEATGLFLAREYEDQAREEQDKSSTYVKWSLIATVAAAAYSVGLAVVAVSSSLDAGHILAKATLVIPVLAVAAQLARLGTTHRRQAWRWRNIALQIKTADPFLAPLATEDRQTLIAALALRFFPGQRHGDESQSAPETIDPAAVLNKLVGEKPLANVTQQPAADPP